MRLSRSLPKKPGFYETGFGRLITHEGMVAAHPERSRVGDTAGEIQATGGAEVLKNIQESKSWFEEGWSLALKQMTYKAFAPVEVGNTGTPWTFSTPLPRNPKCWREPGKPCFLPSLLSALGILLIVGVSLLDSVAHRQTPQKKWRELAVRAQGGDLLTITRQEFGISSKDEMGEMAGGSRRA